MLLFTPVLLLTHTRRRVKCCVMAKRQEQTFTDVWSYLLTYILNYIFPFICHNESSKGGWHGEQITLVIKKKKSQPSPSLFIGPISVVLCVFVLSYSWWWHSRYFLNFQHVCVFAVVCICSTCVVIHECVCWMCCLFPCFLKLHCIWALTATVHSGSQVFLYNHAWQQQKATKWSL